MSDLVENRGEMRDVPRAIAPTGGGFAQVAGWAGFHAVRRRREGCRIGEGRSQSESHLVKPRENTDGRSSARGAAQWLFWLCTGDTQGPTWSRQVQVKNFSGPQSRSHLRYWAFPGFFGRRGIPSAISTFSTRCHPLNSWNIR